MTNKRRAKAVAVTPEKPVSHGAWIVGAVLVVVAIIGVFVMGGH